MGLEARDTSEVALKVSQRRTAAYLRRFHSPFRERVRDFARSGPRRLDLTVVFPAAAIALVTARHGSAASEAALRLVDRGSPLKDVAEALGVPMWVRRLPPEAFARPLGPLPDGEVFTRHISTCGPRSRAVAAEWLANVTFAAEAVGPEFAVWIARQPIHGTTTREVPPLRILAAFAWCSGQAAIPAHAIMSTRWRPDLSLDTALCAAKIWFNRVRLLTLFGKTPIADAWLEGGSVERLRIEPLLSARALIVEAKAMSNCIDQYAKRLAEDRCRLFSIRNAAGEPIGNIEIAQHAREPGVLAIHQLKSRNNAPAPPDLWRAAYLWLARQRSLRRDMPLVVRPREIDREQWAALMGPFTKKSGAACWIPTIPTPQLLEALEGELTKLARRGFVTSWLFA